MSKQLCNFLHPPDTGFFASRFLYFLSEFVPSFTYATLKLNHNSFLYVTGTFIHISIRKTLKVIVSACVWRVEQIFNMFYYSFTAFIFSHAIHIVFVTDNFTLTLYSILGLNLVGVHFYTLYFLFKYMFFKTKHDYEMYQPVNSVFKNTE